MKVKQLLRWILMTAVIGFAGCGDEEKPKTIPEVSTLPASDVTTTSAMLSGEITNDGNDEIVEMGFVYSSAVSVPTTVDNKIEVTNMDDGFEISLEGLSSGTVYHVRAYATNSKGVGYGEVVDFSTANAAPTITNLTITGALEVNKELSAEYTYIDTDGDVEGASIFQWFVANDNSGGGQVAIDGATEATYTLQESQQGKYISVAVMPVAETGTSSGTLMMSGFFGAIGEATTVTFMYNGQEVTYGIIVSTTGRKWLDRNLGAASMPSTTNDFANYGDLFQWGRFADGHQVIVRTGTAAGTVSGVNGTTSLSAPFEYSSGDNPGHSKFIVIDPGVDPYDWRKPQNTSLWQGVNGINNPCPDGWRIPTQAEWAAEGLGTIAEAYSKLKITYTHARGGDGGYFFGATAGRYWSSTLDSSSGVSYAGATIINAAGTTQDALVNASGLACRCIKQ